jgi:hypothetical protein
MAEQAEPTTATETETSVDSQSDAPEQSSDPEFDAALALMRGKSDPEPEKPEEAKQDVPTSTKQEQETHQDPKIDPLDKKLDERFESVTKRLTASETKALQAEQRAKDLEKENARFKELWGYAKTDPAKLFKEMEWDQQKVYDFGTGKYVPPTNAPEVQRVTSLVEQQAKELAELKATLQQRADQDSIAAYKAREITALIPTAVKAEQYPHLHQYYGGDAQEITEEIYAVMNAAYQGGEGKRLTVEEAAHAIELHWKKVAERFSPRASEPEKTSAQKPSPTNAKPKQATPATEDADEPMTDDERRHKEALAVMKAIRREQKSA